MPDDRHFGEVGEIASEDVEQGINLVRFPGGFEFYSHMSSTETRLIYNEIFVQQEYFGGGVSLPQSGCFIDVGANIGLFTLFVLQQVPDAVVHACEPVPETFDVLRRNVQLHGHSVWLHNVAVGAKEGASTEILHYPNMAGNSTACPQVKEQQRAYMNRLFGRERTDFYFRTEPRSAPTQTVSSLIEGHVIDRVDLLKIDTEGGELQVLHGIESHHWARIRQIAVEVHTDEHQTAVGDLLSYRKFHVSVNDGISSPAGNVILNAVREGPA